MSKCAEKQALAVFSLKGVLALPRHATPKSRLVGPTAHRVPQAVSDMIGLRDWGPRLGLPFAFPTKSGVHQEANVCQSARPPITSHNPSLNVANTSLWNSRRYSTSTTKAVAPMKAQGVKNQATTAKER